MGETDYSRQLEAVEGDPVFREMVQAGVVKVEVPRKQRFMPRQAAAFFQLTALPNPVEGHEELALLIRRIGEKLFVSCFLNDESLSDEQRALTCGISIEEACKIRHLVDRAYVDMEFNAHVEAAPQAAVAPVAGIQIEGGRPVLAFYHREIWSGEYVIDESRKGHFLRGLGVLKARSASSLLNRVALLKRRRSSLYRVLTLLIELQSEFLVSEETESLRPLSQRKLASMIGMTSSSVSKLLSNKSLRLASGRTISLNELTPSTSALLARFYDLSCRHPQLNHVGVQEELRRLSGVRLSLRSIRRYRQRLGLTKRRVRKTAQARWSQLSPGA